MAHSFLRVLAITAIVGWAESQVIGGDPSCLLRPGSNHTLRLFINSRKEYGQDGEWVTTYQASNDGSSVDNITLDLTQTCFHCDGHEAVRLTGVVRATKVGGRDRLMFHPKCGTNVAISNDGRSVQKIRHEDGLNGVVLTHRPMRRNEMLEVRIDKKLSLHSWNLGIGVTTHTPELDIPDHMYRLKSGTWIMYHGKLHVNGAITIQNYGKDLNDLKEGDRCGVMFNNNGALHFFVNGEDQGPAASNLPKVLYGFVELSKVSKATLVG